MRATWSDEVARLYPNLNLGQVARLRLNIPVLCILSGETKKTTFLPVYCTSLFAYAIAAKSCAQSDNMKLCTKLART